MFPDPVPFPVPTDLRQIVAAGYDDVADRYAEWIARDVVDEARPRYTALLLERLPPGATVLDLGCGNGVPTTRQLAERFRVTGVDLSARQIELARQNVPHATFIHGDMTKQSFPERHFHAVTAFYSLTHLPHGELPALLRRIVTWLGPGGLFVASMGASTDLGTVEPDWLGAPMYFSGYSVAEGHAIIEGAGLRVLKLQEETILENGEPGSASRGSRLNSRSSGDRRDESRRQTVIGSGGAPPEPMTVCLRDSSLRSLGLMEDLVPANAPPAERDVMVVKIDVFKRGAAFRPAPGHLPHAGSALDVLHAQLLRPNRDHPGAAVLEGLVH